MDGVLELICLRHAESENVVAGLAGALPNAPLTARGRLQAAAMARALTPIEHVYASTAERARQTAEAITRAQGVAVTAMPELVEVRIGGLEGRTDRATRARTAAVLRSWVVDGNLDAGLPTARRAVRWSRGSRRRSRRSQSRTGAAAPSPLSGMWRASPQG
ncbi:histidine phosphatase family protein [Spirillospora sp. NPDC046719]